MPTQTASGSSTSPSASVATKEAVEAALTSLRGRKPTFGVIFASPHYALGDVLTKASQLSPGTELIGCTTAGEITERGLTKGGLALLLVATDNLAYEIRVTRDVTDVSRAAAALSEGFAQKEKESRNAGLVVSTSVLLIDGLSGVGEAVVGELRNRAGRLHEIVGGAAGDDGAFSGTFVGARGEATKNGAVALHAFGSSRWGVGVDHGLTPASGAMRVTKASGSVVYELDGKPAFDVYRKFAKDRGIDLDPKTAGNFLINNELGVLVFDALKKARAPLAVGDDGSLTCAAEIPQGASVCIVGGSDNELVAAARRAAKEAKERLGQRPAAGILLFDCICRGTILGREFGREVEAIASVFPGVPIAGFLTYGEIARYSGRLDGWHNTTAVVAAIPA